MSNTRVTDTIERVWREKDLTAMDAYFDPNVVVHSPLGEFKGIQFIKEVFQKWLIAFPDLVVSEVQVIEQEDRIVRQWEARGTHQGAFKGISATGRPVNYSGATVYRIQEGKVVEYWAYVNVAHVLSQIEQVVPV